MPRKGTDYEAIERALAFEPDGLSIKEVGAWSRNKIALLAYYLPAFAELCSTKAGGWYYLDGFAGNGANVAPGFSPSKGSALVGLTQTPAAHAAVLVERDPDDYEVLTRRCSNFEFARVFNEDVNATISSRLPILEKRYLPGFCLLDPEGLELDWKTVQACAAWRTKGTPYELLIYFSTPGAARSAGVQATAYAPANIERLGRLFGNDSWKPIADLQQRGALPPREAGARYLALYKAQVERLGYTTVIDRPAVREDGNLVYHLIFASANDAGRSIMTSAFSRAYAGQIPLQM